MWSSPRSRFFVLFALVLSFSAIAHSQSLGEIARREHAKKASTPHSNKVITNDEIGSFRKESDLQVRDNAAAPATSDPASGPAEPAQTDAATSDAGADSQTIESAWKAKIAEQKSKIDLLQREIDVLQREQKLRATTYYADAGNRLRDSKQFTEEQKKTNDDLDRKRKDLDNAKADMDRMKEDARKLGLRIS